MNELELKNALSSAMMENAATGRNKFNIHSCANHLMYSLESKKKPTRTTQLHRSQEIHRLSCEKKSLDRKDVLAYIAGARELAIQPLVLLL